MTDLKTRRDVLQGCKILLFFACLGLLTLAGLVLFILNLVRGDQAQTFTWGALLNGTYLEETTGDLGLLQRDIFYSQQTAPTLQLLGSSQIDIEVGGGYTEPGYSAESASGQDLTAEVDSYIDGDFLCYAITDADGNSTTARRSITYVDTTAPELTLVDGDEVHLILGTEYEEPGYSAQDNSDGDITSQVQVSGTVEKLQEGVYPITYTVSDHLGNTTTVTRQVYVEAAVQPEVVDPGENVIYLTFDDGPGAYTEELLDILDKYNVKATFFVTNQEEEYQDMIGEEFRRGHSVAIHTYSHDFSVVYESDEAYFEDLNKMQEIVEAQTGQKTTLIRFPGGSSNTVSSNYSVGIMSRLVDEVEAMGYQYFDWNVSSGDAGGTTDTDTVISNVISDITANGGSPCVVLQHDIKEFSVNAVESIIQWGLENGYTFLPLDSTSPKAHHGVNN